MRVMASTMFFLMMFPHDGNIVSMDQVTYHDPHGPMALANIIPTIDTALNITTTTPLLNVAHELFTYTSMKTSPSCHLH